MPFNVDSNSAFNKLCLWLESEASTDLLTLDELQEKMERFFESNEAYSTKWLKKKLKDRYSDHLLFAEINGRKNVLCFKNMTIYIINEKWYEKRQINVDDESKRIVITAAKLIREEIRNIKLSLDSYPNKDNITDSINENSCWKPNLLNTLLSYVVPEAVKRSSICQCIIKASRPRTALPALLFRLGIECDHVFGSKWLLNELFNFGFPISYSEVNNLRNQ